MSSQIALRDTSILISDVDRRKALPVVRSLGRAGVRVVGLSSTTWPIAGLSRYCGETLRCPNYRTAPRDFCDCLQETLERRRPTVFLPLEDVLIELCLAEA